MRLTDLVDDADITMVWGAAKQAMEVTGLSADSRSVEPGFLFAALPGSHHDGRAFIDEALGKGAIAVLAPPATELRDHGRPVALITDTNPRRRLAQLAARFHPGQPRTIAAVTGTNGKTSVTDFTRQIWTSLGHKAASLGTLGLIPALGHQPASLTTPDPVELHACLSGLRHEGYDHLVLEASSHGLDQYRLDGVKVSVAAFTNLSRDHLDYHAGMSAYFAAKRRLFAELVPAGGTVVLNADTPEFEDLAGLAAERGQRVLAYGHTGADIKLLGRQAGHDGQALHLEVLGQRRELRLPLAGAFQAHNALCALGLAIATGAEPEAATAVLGRLEGVPGRLELVGRTLSGGTVYVDYSHKPGALEAALSALRPHAAKRLLVVFGAGGDRDRGKRPMMGEIAQRLADRVIVTDDNPRSEDPAEIRREILAAAPEAEEIGDRKAAILQAVAELGEGDLLVIAGKGHEPYQIIGTETLPFDDREVARQAIAALGTPQA